MFPLVLRSPSFYVLVALHGLFCYLDTIDTIGEELEWSLFGAQRLRRACAVTPRPVTLAVHTAPGVPTSFLIFFLVFYGNQ